MLPNGGETLKTGQTFDISWNSQNIKNVIIALLQGDSRVYLISSKNGIDTSLKKFQWKIDKDAPYIGRSDLKVALYNSAYCAYVDEATGVECAKDGNIQSDISDNYFSIISGN